VINEDHELKIVYKENICKLKKKILLKSNSFGKVKLSRLIVYTLEDVK